MAAIALVTAGCGEEPSRLDPTSRAVAEQRAVMADSMLEAARTAADQLGGGVPLGVRTDTYCNAGERGSPHNDDDQYRSTCHLVITTAYPVDIAPVPELPGLTDRLAAIGWTNTDGWTLTAGRGVVEDLEAWNRLGFMLDDLDSIRYSAASGAGLVLRLQASTAIPTEPEPLAEAQTGRGSYFATTEGENWQDALRTQQVGHPYVLIVRGFGDFANQPW